jgi:hypothetical protein
MAVTYELKRLGNGGVAVFSRFTGEIIPGLEKTVTANILNDPYANARASYNIRKLGEYLRNMSGRAEYVDVIDDVVVNDTMAVALCYTGDRVYLKRVPEGEEETPAYWFEYQGSLAAGAHFYNDVIYIFSLLADRHGDIVFRYRVKMEQ